MQSNKISQLNVCPFKSKIVIKQLEFTVLILCSTRTGSDQGGRGIWEGNWNKN